MVGVLRGLCRQRIGIGKAEGTADVIGIGKAAATCDRKVIGI